MNNFNPRFPRGKRLPAAMLLPRSAYFNPRFPRGKRPLVYRPYRVARLISIHASRGGSDILLHVMPASFTHFNPRFPRGKRQRPALETDPDRLFQSTLPAGEATPSFTNSRRRAIFQSTLPAGEATNGNRFYQVTLYNFNPRFPRGKRPGHDSCRRHQAEYFNPRFPRGKRHSVESEECRE